MINVSIVWVEKLCVIFWTIIYDIRISQLRCKQNCVCSRHQWTFGIVSTPVPFHSSQGELKIHLPSKWSGRTNIHIPPSPFIKKKKCFTVIGRTLQTGGASSSRIFTCSKNRENLISLRRFLNILIFYGSSNNISNEECVFHQVDFTPSWWHTVHMTNYVSYFGLNIIFGSVNFVE